MKELIKQLWWDNLWMWRLLTLVLFVITIYLFYFIHYELFPLIEDSLELAEMYKNLANKFALTLEEVL